MFTRLIKPKGSYMALVALAAIAVAALATLLQTQHSTQNESKSASGHPEQVVTGRLTQYTESSVTFIN